MASPEAKVLREGKPVILPSAQIVPGDIVILETGDIVPADLRLTSSNLKIDESSLTGESVAVDKDARHLTMTIRKSATGKHGALSTIVSYGRGRGVAVETGHKTEIGRSHHPGDL